MASPPWSALRPPHTRPRRVRAARCASPPGCRPPRCDALPTPSVSPLQALLGSGARSAHEVAAPLWRRICDAVLSALGTPEAAADLSFEETTAALQALARLATHPLAAHALLDSGAMEVR